MSESRQATVQPVEESAATGRVAEIYADIRETKGIDFVPRFWRVIATNPVQLDVVWSSLKKLMHPEAVGGTSRLDPAVREMIAVAVSASNGCSYCINSHTTALKKHGVDDETIGEVLAVAGLFNMTNALADGYQIEPDVLPPLE
ncbi:MAG: carboxymuconolactone decarboxylase family protein [Planctomycetota bacterium]|jgi:AhpD family alkylhydroperoxidase